MTATVSYTHLDVYKRQVEPSVSGPPRRYYRATPAGRDALVDWTAAWRATRDSLDAVLKEATA